MQFQILLDCFAQDGQTKPKVCVELPETENLVLNM